jgi:hypothetical protein
VGAGFLTDNRGWALGGWWLVVGGWWPVVTHRAILVFGRALFVSGCVCWCCWAWVGWNLIENSRCVIDLGLRIAELEFGLVRFAGMTITSRSGYGAWAVVSFGSPCKWSVGKAIELGEVCHLVDSHRRFNA